MSIYIFFKFPGPFYVLPAVDIISFDFFFTFLVPERNFSIFHSSVFHVFRYLQEQVLIVYNLYSIYEYSIKWKKNCATPYFPRRYLIIQNSRNRLFRFFPACFDVTDIGFAFPECLNPRLNLTLSLNHPLCLKRSFRIFLYKNITYLLCIYTVSYTLSKQFKYENFLPIYDVNQAAQLHRASQKN